MNPNYASTIPLELIHAFQSELGVYLSLHGAKGVNLFLDDVDLDDLSLTANAKLLAFLSFAIQGAVFSSFKYAINAELNSPKDLNDSTRKIISEQITRASELIFNVIVAPLNTDFYSEETSDDANTIEI